jgi:hypothetical protein
MGKTDSEDARKVARFRRLSRVGMGMVAAGVLFWLSSDGASMRLVFGIDLTILGAMAIGWGRRYARWSLDIEHVNTASRAMGADDAAAAESALAKIPERSRRGVVGLAVHVVRSRIELARGDAPAAVAAATRAVETKVEWIAGRGAGAMRSYARARRAFALAASGEAEAALADVEALRADASANSAALALAGLTSAYLAAARGDVDGLRREIAHHGVIAFDRVSASERVLARALRRMAHAPRAGAYREPGEVGEPDASSSKAVAWVAQIAPFAAPYATDVGGSGRASNAAASHQGAPAASFAVPAWRVRAVHHATGLPQGRSANGLKTLALWVVLVVMFLTIWQFLAPSPRPEHLSHHEPLPAEIDETWEDDDDPMPDGLLIDGAVPAELLIDGAVPADLARGGGTPEGAPPYETYEEAFDAEPEGTSVGVLVATGIAPIALVVGLFALVIVQSSRRTRELEAAEREVELGRGDAVAPRLTAIAERWRADLGSSAHAMALLAHLAEKRGQFAAAIATCDAALARMASVTNGIASMTTSPILPTLLAHRAVSLAALGRVEEAEDELGAVRAEFASFPALDAIELRVRLLSACARRDAARAQEVLRLRSTETPLALRDELLGRLASALAGGMPRGEMAWVEGELRDGQELCAWIDAIWPGLRDEALARAN